MEGLIRQCGIPLAVYSDRHAVFKHTGEPRQKPAGPTQFARAMEELGIRQIFARSPQAKGRVERTAGTFQDRLVTELRLAGVTTIDEANAVLHRFLPRFNEKFGVPAEHSSVAYRPMESSMSLDQILCFKHRRKVVRDNAVKYNWRTLQLLPGKERPSYAGAQLEVHEGLDGQLLVQYRGRTIPTQEAPPRPGVLRASNGPLRYGPGLDRRVNGVGSHPKESSASLGVIEADSATLNGGGKPPASPRRKPTPRQRVRWKAVQQANLRPAARYLRDLGHADGGRLCQQQGGNPGSVRGVGNLDRHAVPARHTFRSQLPTLHDRRAHRGGDPASPRWHPERAAPCRPTRVPSRCCWLGMANATMVQLA